MAEEIAEPPQSPVAAPEKPRKIHRVRIGANVVTQIALVLFLAAMVNYLGFSHYKRWDLSRDQRYALSDKSQRFLDSIKGKMRITVLFGPNAPITQDVQNLLTQYQYASRGKIDVEHIDPERNLSRAREVFDKYKVVSDESVLILEYEGRHGTVKASEMAEVDQGNPMFGEAPRVTAFKGEQAVTAAMMDLVEGKKNTIGYVTGHKEPPLADAAPTMSEQLAPQQGARSPVSVLRLFVENENVQLQELSLFDVPAIPEEIRTIMILGPQYDLSEREITMLRAFWNKQGRILLLLDAPGSTPRLNTFLQEVGVTVNDDRLLAIMRTGIQETAFTRDVQARFLPGSPITRLLTGAGYIFPGGSSSITLDQERVRDANIRLQPLIEAEKGYWSEKDYNSNDAEKLQASAMANQDRLHSIAASIEKGGSEDDRVQANSARMVVVGNATFVRDTALTQDQQGLDFISGSINWLINREQLIGIAPKVPQTLTFNLSDDALRNLRWIILALLPLLPALAGIAVWWQRRT
ncbi:hypothetical protein BH20VER1_BH20VER1_27060 [soil metagenome]